MFEQIELLIIDDEQQMLDEMKLLLETVGNFKVTAYISAKKALERLEDLSAEPPAMVISDITMPEMDGYEFGKRVREEYRLRHIPLLFLTAKSAVKDRIDARKITPHYFPKDGDRRELLSMIQSILEEHMVQVGINPLTRLPGNTIIESTVNKIVAREHDYNIFYIDFDNFKAYNDSYGTHAGDKAIQESAIAIDRALRMTGENCYFLGHVGGDDFVSIVWGGNDPEKICVLIFEEINKVRNILYSDSDIRRGYFEAKNRQGVVEKYGLLSVSIGVISSRISPVSGWAEASNRLASVKKKAKATTGNSYCIDRRKE